MTIATLLRRIDRAKYRAQQKSAMLDLIDAVSAKPAVVTDDYQPVCPLCGELGDFVAEITDYQCTVLRKCGCGYFYYVD